MGKGLGGEANAPGLFSRRTLEIIGSMTRRDAELFVTLLSFGDPIFQDGAPFVFEPESPLYSDRGLGSVALRHLQTLGLVQVLDLNDWQFASVPAATPPARGSVLAFGRRINVEAPHSTVIALSMGKVLLTQYGLELLRICDRVPAPDGFAEVLADKWRQQGYVVTVLS